MEPSHILIRPFCSQNSSPVNFGGLTGPCLKALPLLQITQADFATDEQLLMWNHNEHGAKWPQNLMLHLASQAPCSDHSMGSQFPTPVAAASPNFSGSAPQARPTHTRSLWAPKMGGKLGNCGISTRLADTNYTFLTQEFKGQMQCVLWAVNAALHITSPPIGMAFNPWLPPARENEMVRNLLGFIIMHNNLLYITT